MRAVAKPQHRGRGRETPAAAEARGRRDAAILPLAFCAGLRRSEIAALVWGDITPTARAGQTAGPRACLEGQPEFHAPRGGHAKRGHDGLVACRRKGDACEMAVVTTTRLSGRAFWVALGATSGRGRLDRRRHRAGETRKTVGVCPLVGNA